MMGREAFQEIDYRHMFGPMAKWVAQIDSADRIPELISRAFNVATSGRPGPVVLALPEDMLVDETSAADAAPYAITRVHPAEADVEGSADAPCGRRAAARDRRRSALDGRGAATALSPWCRAGGVPSRPGHGGARTTSTTYRRLRGPPWPRPRSASHRSAAGLRRAARDRYRLSDIRLRGSRRRASPGAGAGTRSRSPPTGGTGRVYTPTLGSSHLPAFATSLAATPARRRGRSGGRDTAGRTALSRESRGTGPAPGKVDTADVMAVLRARLPADAILTNGAGNFTVWAHRFSPIQAVPYATRADERSDGLRVPAAVAAKILDPRRTVVCIAGDGDFLMTGQELATAVQEQAAIVVLVVNNGMYGTIRMHQERHYPGRVSGRISSIPTLRHWLAPSGHMARSSSGPPTSASRSRRRSPVVDPP